MVDIGINAWSSLFDNLKINIILQDYLESVWKTVIIWETVAANQRKADNERTEIFSLEKTINGYPRREKEGIKDKNEKFPQWIFGSRSQD